MPDPLVPDGRMLAGSCLCGSVRYAVADAFAYAANCHCSNCRRATGAAFKPFAGIARERLRLTAGIDLLRVYDGDAADLLDGGGPGMTGGGRENVLARDAGDMHCGRCGSLLYSIVRDGAFVHVAMGSLTDMPTIRPTAHIFTGSKAPWYTITDTLPQFLEHPTPA